MPAMAGTYVNVPMDALLAVVAEQSERHSCVVIGEDLGTVPEDFRRRLDRWGLWTYRVMQFERDAQGQFHSPQSYPERALVTFATHDLPTFAGWWSGHDLKVRHDIGIGSGDTVEEREHARSALRDALLSDGPWRDGAFSAVARHLAATPSRIVCVSLEDILGLIDQPNLPGTIDQYPNWRVRLPNLIDDLALDERLCEIAAVMRAAGRSTA
jgi:4-alpha-glucanotransferase